MDSILGSVETVRNGAADRSHVSLSYAVPVYGCPEALPSLCARIKAVCGSLGRSYEIILVDDRCPKGSWSVIQQIAQANPEVIGVRLSRNFGQHAAIQAALRFVSGDWAVVMDCDLQDRPEALPALLEKAEEGWDIVQAQRSHRSSDAWSRRLLSNAFYRTLTFLSGTDQDPAVANFGVYNRKVIEVIRSWNEETKYFPSIIRWVGFSRTSVPVLHSERLAGQSSYSMRRLLRLAGDVVIGFSDRPLRLLVTAGFVVSATSFLTALVVALLYIAGRIEVQGWASLALSLWFLSGWLTFSLGLTGLYVGRILAEAKGRPVYIIDTVTTQSSA